MFSIKFFLFGALLPLLFSCSENSQKESNSALALLLVDGINFTQTTEQNLNKIVTTNEGNQTFKTLVNATSTKEWVYFRFSDGAQVSSTSNDWDLRFKRFIMGTNSGTSGSGNAGACATNTTDFLASITSQTCSSFFVDILQAQTGGGSGMGDVSDSANPVLFNWYDYNNTILTSKRIVYVVRNFSGNQLYKIQILDYYSQAGTSGYVTFRWSKIE